MKREIKFRAMCEVDGEESKMIYFLPQIFDNGVFAWPMPDNISHIDEYNSPLMQYTGLKDKNGKEIYEGDIVDLRPDQNDKIWHRVIEYDTAAFHSRAIHTNANHPLHFHKYSPNKDWVVIGNIYENPELLK